MKNHKQLRRSSRSLRSVGGSAVAIVLLPITLAFAQVNELQTVAESSDFQATAPYAQVLDFCEALAKSSPHVHLTRMGQTHEKRDIPLLIIADPPIKTAAEAKADPRPVVFAMGNIHAGEVCGKEALLMLARDLIQKKSPVYKELILVFAPIYNADGNERFATTNRRGQIGPSQGMGQRHNAMDLDLNRDHMKLESPEARSLAKFMADWEPIIAMDLHTTDGSFHRYRLTYDSPRHPATDAALQKYGRDDFLPAISRQLVARNADDLTFYYGNFDRTHENWRSYPAAPRYSTHYFGLRNSLGILSEAYAFISYRERIRMTYHFVDEILKRAVTEKVAITKLVADARLQAAKEKSVAVRFQPTPFDRMFKIPGYKEAVARRGRPAKDSDEKTEYEVRYHGISRATLSVTRPKAYVIPKAHSNVIANLRNHGVTFETVAKPRDESVTAYTVTNYEKAEQEFQGHRMVSKVEVKTEVRTASLAAGDVVVPTNQPLARLIVNLLEPQSADGLCTWNSFDKAIEAGPYPILRIEQ